MTPQSGFMVMAPIAKGRIDELKLLLAKMNLPNSPGMADPKNAILPFGEFDRLHFARFVILDDQTLGDFGCADLPVPEFKITLAFLGDCDGPADELLKAFAEHKGASSGLRQIFEHCESFGTATDLLAWMRQHSVRAAANYINWIGRSVPRVHVEAKLRLALQNELASYVKTQGKANFNVRGARNHLRNFADQNPELIPPQTRTPIGWWVCNFFHFAVIPFLLLLPWLIAVPCLLIFPWLLTIPWLIPFAPFFWWIVVPFVVLAILVFLWLVRIAPWTFALLVALGLMLVPFFILFPVTLFPLLAAIMLFLIVLRRYEKSEPQCIPPPTDEHDTALAQHEDYDVSNQYSVIGSVKPSAFRRALLTVILWLTDYGARHVYNRGYLSRIQTIHFARWVFVDDKRRVFFASNYDGSHQAYMDDFINKVGWGLNIVFSNGFGYPRTNWLICDGAKNEQRFKDTNRRHQIPTQVWYKAYPGLTAFDLARNTRIRKGLQRPWMTEAAIRAWLREL